MDRQRNDHLGWASLWRPFKQRRQILRGCTESDTHTNIFPDSNFNGHGNCNCNRNRNTYSYRDAFGYGELHAQADSYAEVSADAPTAPVVSSDFPLAVGPTIKNARIQSDSVSKKVGHASRLP